MSGEFVIGKFSCGPESERWLEKCYNIVMKTLEIFFDYV